MSTDGHIKAYSDTTEQLRWQLAGLEIVVKIRDMIERETNKRSYRRGIYSNDMQLHIERTGLQSYGRRASNLHLLLANKSLAEQKILLETMLQPYANKGTVPKFHIGEAFHVGESVPHAVIKFDYSLGQPSV